MMNANEIIEEIKRQAIEEHKNAVTWYVYAKETDNEKRADMYLRFSREAASKEEIMCRLLDNIIGTQNNMRHNVYLNDDYTKYVVTTLNA